VRAQKRGAGRGGETIKTQDHAGGLVGSKRGGGWVALAGDESEKRSKMRGL